jgi:hypothetical protein
MRQSKFRAGFHRSSQTGSSPSQPFAFIREIRRITKCSLPSVSFHAETFRAETDDAKPFSARRPNRGPETCSNGYATIPMQEVHSNLDRELQVPGHLAGKGYI